MKVISKRLLKKKNFVNDIKGERDIMAKVDCPFVVRMHASFQTREKVRGADGANGRTEGWREGWKERWREETATISLFAHITDNPSLACFSLAHTQLFLIMDFLAGGELFYHLGLQGLLLESQCAFYVSEIILALQHLHDRSILHRDLKPENILLGSDGHCCLTDFGLAKEFKEETEEVRAKAASVATCIMLPPFTPRCR